MSCWTVHDGQAIQGVSGANCDHGAGKEERHRHWMPDRRNGIEVTEAWKPGKRFRVWSGPFLHVWLRVATGLPRSDVGASASDRYLSIASRLTVVRGSADDVAAEYTLIKVEFGK